MPVRKVQKIVFLIVCLTATYGTLYLSSSPHTRLLQPAPGLSSAILYLKDDNVTLEQYCGYELIYSGSDHIGTLLSMLLADSIQ